eukprot:30453-Pelagococcus_subviridis.AAC.6
MQEGAYLTETGMDSGSRDIRAITGKGKKRMYGFLRNIHGSQLLSGQGRAVRWAQEEDKIIEGYIKTVARTETISFTVIGGVAMAYELRCFLVAVSRKRPCSCVRSTTVPN